MYCLRRLPILYPGVFFYIFHKKKHPTVLSDIEPHWSPPDVGLEPIRIIYRESRLKLLLLGRGGVLNSRRCTWGGRVIGGSKWGIYIRIVCVV